MRLTCVVDNSVSRGSDLWGEHGLSFLIQTPAGNALWDTGQSGTVLEHNLRELKLDQVELAGLALSHAHRDHTGGLDVVASRYPQVPIYAHEAIFRERYSRREGVIREIGGIAAKQNALIAAGNLRLSRDSQEIVPHVSTTGGIRCRPFPQSASPNLLVRQGDKFVADTFSDDMSLVLEVDGGLVLLCGCCHAGLRNTLAAVRSQYKKPLLAIIGGTHLLDADDAELGALVAILQAEHAPKLYLNHCTGEKAIRALVSVFGELVAPCPAGTVLEFPDEVGP